MDQTLTTRYVLRFEPLALHPRLHHREGFPIHYLPPREPPPRRIFTIREYRTPLSNTASQPRGRPVAKQPQHLYRRGLQIPTPPLTRGRKQQPTPPLTRGSKPTTRSTSTKEGYNKNKGVQLGGYNNLKQFLFFH